MEKETILPKDLLEDIYKKVTDKVERVYSIFKDFYTEELVDLQGVISKAEVETYIVSHSPKFFCGTVDIDKSLNSINLEETDKQAILDFIKANTDTIATVMQMNLHNHPLPTILVFFPKVTVTNEENDSIEITELWVRVYIDYEGRSTRIFTMNRSEYTEEQFYSDYLHSHVCGIPKHDPSNFLDPCLGRGPIRGTITSLLTHYDETSWELFCFELSKYVETESLVGVPYRYIRNVSSSSGKSLVSGLYTKSKLNLVIYDKVILRSFIIYLVQAKKLKFSYRNNTYELGMSLAEFISTTSNLFIEWSNSIVGKKVLKAVNVSQSTLIHNNSLFDKGWIIDDKVYYESIRQQTGSIRANGSVVCTFKGAPVHLKITSSASNEGSPSLLISSDIASYIAQLITKIVNFYYEADINRNKTLI